MNDAGRWPANVALDEDAAALLDSEFAASTHRPPLAGRQGGLSAGTADFMDRWADVAPTKPRGAARCVKRWRGARRPDHIEAEASGNAKARHAQNARPG